MISKVVKKFLITFLVCLLLATNTKTRKVYAQIDENAFDFSRPNSLDTMSISLDELIYKITNESVSSAEQAYLKKLPHFKYEGKINSSLVSTSIENNHLVIHAEPYTYKDNDDRLIQWIPSEISFENETKEFNYLNHRYECIIENISQEEESIYITYRAEFTLKKESINQLLNSAYDYAHYYVTNQILEKEQQEYLKKYEQYLIQKEKYEQYLLDLKDYERQNALYQTYLLNKQAYDEQKAKYEAYLIEYANYQNELKKYDEYLNALKQYDIDNIAYQKYLEDKKQYDKDMEVYNQKYQDYQEKMEKVNYQLNSMELIVTSMTSLNRSIYNAIMGGAVSQVLDKKNMLIDLGVNKEIVETAEDATYWLKDFLPKYFSLKTSDAKYQAYQNNYRLIKANLEKLLRSLEKLYRDGIVNKGLEYLGEKDSKYKEKYLILLAQLVLVCNAIDDNKVKNYEADKNLNNKGAAYFDETWKIDGKNLMQLLENDVDFVDMNGFSYPLLNGYPSKPIAPSTLEEVNAPILPEVVGVPIEPIRVEAPKDEPIEVLPPTLPQKVDLPLEPTPPQVDPILQDLITEYENGTLQKKEEFKEDVKLSLFSSFKKNFKNTNTIIVEFYDQNKNFLGKYETEYGFYIVYDGIIPQKDGDEIYSEYEFSHWEYANGEKFDSNCVVKEGFLYPVFKGIRLTQYEITWMIDGKATIESYDYGSIPTFKGNIIKEPDSTYYYEFFEWDKEIVPVTQNQIYIAQFHQRYIVPLKEGGATIQQNDKNMVIVDSKNASDTNIDLEKVLELYTNQKIMISNEKWIIEISSSTIMQLKNENVKWLNILIDDKGNGEYFYIVQFIDKNNELIDKNLELDIQINGSFKPLCSTLYLIENDNLVQPIRAKIEKDKLVASIISNKQYHIYPSYSIVVSNLEAIKVTIDKTEAKYNEFISYSIQILKEGIDNVSIKIIKKSTGEEVLTLKNGFYMPDDDVYMIISYTMLNYTINFISDGYVISSNKYIYGSEVIIPSNPVKASDDKYEYTFIGWDKEISTVTGNMDYIAVFEQTPIKRERIPYQMSIVKKIEIGIIALLSFLICLLFYRIYKKRKIQYKKGK